MLDLGALGPDDFEPFIGGAFDVAVPAAQRLELTLRAVRRLRAPGEGRTPFSLDFAGPLAPALDQRIWTLTHPDMGALEIFLVPMGPLDDGMAYEAVFG